MDVRAISDINGNLARSQYAKNNCHKTTLREFLNEN